MISAVFNALLPMVEAPTPVAPPGSEKFMLIANWVLWGASIGCIIAVVVLGVIMAISNQRGDGGEMGKRFGLTMIGCAIVGAATGIAGALV